MKRFVHSRGITFLEVLIVLVLLGIVVAVAVPQEPRSLASQLEAAAQVVQSHLAYARWLAVSQGDRYQIRFLPKRNQYILEYAGTQPDRIILPPGPLDSPGSPAHQRTVRLDQWPTLGPQVRLWLVKDLQGNDQDRVVFEPLGNTAHPVPVHIWLTAGQGSWQQYIALTVHPATGIVVVEPVQSTPP